MRGSSGAASGMSDGSMRMLQTMVLSGISVEIRSMKKLIEKCTTETSRRALKADLRRLEDRREAMNRKREEQTARQRAARPTAPGDKKKSARFEQADTKGDEGHNKSHPKGKDW